MTHSFPTRRSSALACFFGDIANVGPEVQCVGFKLLPARLHEMGLFDNMPLEVLNGVEQRAALPVGAPKRTAKVDDVQAHIRRCRSAKKRGDEGEGIIRSEEHTSELQSLMRISYAVFCLKKKK